MQVSTVISFCSRGPQFATWWCISRACWADLYCSHSRITLLGILLSLVWSVALKVKSLAFATASSHCKSSFSLPGAAGMMHCPQELGQPVYLPPHHSLPCLSQIRFVQCPAKYSSLLCLRAALYGLRTWMRVVYIGLPCMVFRPESEYSILIDLN